MDQITPWSIDGEVAWLKTEDLQTRVDLANPSNGLVALKYRDQSLEKARLFQLSPSLPTAREEEGVADRYTRGDDLVATYPQTLDRTAVLQVYWRSLNFGNHNCGLELIISTHTSLLDIHPEIQSSSCLPAAEVWWMTGTSHDVDLSQFEPLLTTGNSPRPIDPHEGVGLFLFRLRGHETSYAEMILPTDFQGGSIGQENPAEPTICLRYVLFPDRLEKGVIRRARMRGLFLPRRNDRRLAADFYRQLIEAEPPLTV